MNNNREKIEKALQTTITGLIELQTALNNMWDETADAIYHLDIENQKTRSATRNALTNALSVFENEIN